MSIKNKCLVPLMSVPGTVNVCTVNVCNDFGYCFLSKRYARLRFIEGFEHFVGNRNRAEGWRSFGGKVRGAEPLG